MYHLLDDSGCEVVVQPDHKTRKHRNQSIGRTRPKRLIKSRDAVAKHCDQLTMADGGQIRFSLAVSPMELLGGSVGQQREVFGGGVEVRRPGGRSSGQVLADHPGTSGEMP